MPVALGCVFAEAVAVEHLDILLRQRLPEVLVADAPRRVAGAALLRAQDAELDARRCITLAKAVATLRLRASNEPMQPTQ